MDPTAIFQMINTFAQIWLVTLQSMTPEDRAANAHMVIQNMQWWQNLLPKAP